MNTYKIYQIPHVVQGEEGSILNRDKYLYTSLEKIKEQGLSVKKENYNMVYEESYEGRMNLDLLYQKFNFEHPDGYTGRSMSVSDVIVLNEDGVEQAYYVDRFGFPEVREWFGKKRLYVDMDGTLAVFKKVDTLEKLYEKDYFLNLEPHENVVSAVKLIIEREPNIEVNVLSAILTDSPYALEEKNEWLDKYIPEIKLENRVFVPCGSDKKAAINGISENDFLLDDYTHNLNNWEPPARGIKLINAINHTRGTWKNDSIRYTRSPQDMADTIADVVHGLDHVRDKGLKDVKHSR